MLAMAQAEDDARAQVLARLQGALDRLGGAAGERRVYEPTASRRRRTPAQLAQTRPGSRLELGRRRPSATAARWRARPADARARGGRRARCRPPPRGARRAGDQFPPTMTSRTAHPGANRCEVEHEIAARGRTGSGARGRARRDRHESPGAIRPTGRPAAFAPPSGAALPQAGTAMRRVLARPPRPAADASRRWPCSSSRSSAGGIGGHVAVRADAVLPAQAPETCASGKMPSPRSASVLGHSPITACRSATIAELVLGQVGAVDQAPVLVDLGGVRQQLPAAAGRTARGSRGPPWAARPGGCGSAGGAGSRPRRRDRGGDRRLRAPRAPSAAPDRAVGSGSSAKTRSSWSGEPRPAVRVEREAPLRARKRAAVDARLHVDHRAAASARSRPRSAASWIASDIAAGSSYVLPSG